jgi:DNA-binding response OmpR family regulator
MAAQLRVLVVDDEKPMADLIGRYVLREGWQLLKAADGETALTIALKHRPDVVVLDLMLPEIDGLEVCRRLRSFSDAYVLMLTARGEEMDKVVGLSVGADDYLVKPFSPRELVARIRAMTRRPRATGAAATLPDGFEIDESRHDVRIDGRAVELTALEFALLVELARQPGAVLGRQTLLDHIWGPDFIGDGHLVDVHIANLRRRLGDDAAAPRFVQTVRGVGYRLRA